MTFFYNSEKLTDIAIPDTITAIGEFAFGNCIGLQSITVPENVATIGSGAFIAGDKFTDIYVSEKNKNFSSVDGILFDKTETKLIAHPVGRTYDEYIIPSMIIRTLSSHDMLRYHISSKRTIIIVYLTYDLIYFLLGIDSLLFEMLCNLLKDD